MGSIFGKNFRVATFGESHGPAVGAVIDGVPAGLYADASLIQKDLDRRRPGQSLYTTSRQEADKAEILSGLTADGLTSGAPLTIVIRNQGARSSDYDTLADKFRPGHADWTYFQKYGLPPQPGGGRSSGRETAGRVAAGAIARIMLSKLPQGPITVRSGASAVGPVQAVRRDFAFAETDALRFLDPDLALEAQTYVLKAMSEGDSAGAAVEVRAEGLPAGWGWPVFDKLEALLGQAYFSIGAVRAVEFGEGIALAASLGSQASDPLGPDGPLGDLHGGVLGGISTGRPLLARLFVRPTPSIQKPQKSVNLKGQSIDLSTGGRHDPCLAPRLAPVAEAMTLLVLADMLLSPPARWDSFF
ncbi:MAG: chorismate synthase [Deltaproteobacteria bacterium]|jgi:chorismate synthase|nr:chorismate synthase [Deltaproteobacteria bacterium]